MHDLSSNHFAKINQVNSLVNIPVEGDLSFAI